MDARLLRCAVLAAAACSLGASYRTKNFIVSAPTPQMAEQIGQAAEKYRRELAQDWLGREMPNWAQPCPITAQVGDHLGAGGATSFVFEHGEVFGWRMTIQGSLTRILDSVLPHEVTHTVFATHFRRPLPRWADEGACTTVEHASERSKQQHMLVDFLRTNRGIAFSQMFAMKEYPADVLPLYSQGYSVARYLVAQGGKRKFLEYLADGLRDENWSRATRQHYGIENLAALQTQWLDWVRKGSPNLQAPGDTPALASVTPKPSDAPVAVASTAGNRGQLAGAPARRPGPSSASGDGPTVYELAATSTEALQAAPAEKAQWRRPRPAGESAADTGEGQSIADAAALAQHQVTRPQPIERPRQVILEWSRPYPGEPAKQASAASAYPAPSTN